jgi:hypothetical protein
MIHPVSGAAAVLVSVQAAAAIIRSDIKGILH